MRTFLLKYLLNFFYLTILGMLLIDSYKNPNTISQFLLLSSHHFLLLFLIVNFILILKKISQISKSLLLFNTYILLPATSVLTIAMAIFDQVYYRNYSFSISHFHFNGLSYIVYLSLLVFIINSNKSWLLENMKKNVFFGGLLLIIFALHINLWPNDVFAKLSHEDGPIEYMQFLVLIISSFLAFYVANKLMKKYTLFAVLYFFIGITFFLIAGDEISWGQRIVGIKTPQSIGHYNHQDEITIHNSSFIARYVPLGYVIVGFYGAFAWILRPIAAKYNKLSYLLIPPVFTSIYFFTVFIFNSYTLLGDHYIGVFSEFAELMLYLGILIFMISNLLRLKTSKK